MQRTRNLWNCGSDDSIVLYQLALMLRIIAGTVQTYQGDQENSEAKRNADQVQLDASGILDMVAVRPDFGDLGIRFSRGYNILVTTAEGILRRWDAKLSLALWVFLADTLGHTVGSL